MWNLWLVVPVIMLTRVYKNGNTSRCGDRNCCGNDWVGENVGKEWETHTIEASPAAKTVAAKGYVQLTFSSIHNTIRKSFGQLDIVNNMNNMYLLTSPFAMRLLSINLYGRFHGTVICEAIPLEVLDGWISTTPDSFLFSAVRRIIVSAVSRKRNTRTGKASGHGQLSGH